MKSFLQNDIKDQNRKIIFDIFLQEPNLAKIEVANRTTMSTVTVNKVVDFFEQIGIVKLSGEERDGSGGRGRKRVVYQFAPNAYLSIGIQMIGNKLSALLVNLYGEVIDTVEIDQKVMFYEEGLVELVEQICEQFRKKVEGTTSHIIGVGIGVDGAINTGKGIIRMRTVDDQEEDYFYEDVCRKISERVHLPIVLENDVNAAAVAEFSHLERIGSEPNDLLLISLGEGVGAGLILEKKLYKGRHSGAGELEYMCFDSDYIAKPSAVGWLESKIGLDNLYRKFQFEPGGKRALYGQDRVECVNYISKYLALAIINVVSLLGVRSVVLSGKTVLEMRQEIIAATKRYIRQFTGWDLDIQCGTMHYVAAAGAAIIAMEQEMTKVISGQEEFEL